MKPNLFHFSLLGGYNFINYSNLKGQVL